jgi:hypothetical protein
MNAPLHLVPLSAVLAARRIDTTRHTPTLEPTPWVPVRLGNSWRLRRTAPRGNGWEIEFFYGGNRRPLVLRESDAQALADALNRWRRGAMGADRREAG